MGFFNVKKDKPGSNSPMPDMSMQGMQDQSDMNAMPQDMNMPGQDPYAQQQQQYYYDQQQGQDMQQMPQDPGMQMPPQQDFQQYPSQNFSSQSVFPSPQSFSGDTTKERIEEIAEAIIDEKWNELIKDINKVVEWKERTDGEIKKIQQEIQDLKERFESLHRGILGKIGEYDQNLTNVGTEIKSMEMVFQKILPTFTENVNKLDRIVKSTSPK